MRIAQDDVFRKLVQNLERELTIFKEKQRQVYDELAVEEASLEDALQHMDQRFTNWSHDTYCEKDPSTALATAPQIPAKPRFEDARLTKIRGALEELQATIDKNGGEFGHWSKEDHDCFYRVYVKNMTQDKTGTLFYKTIAHLLPTISHESVVEHVNWFIQHEERKQEKKKYLTAWRDRRDQLRCAQAEEASEKCMKAEAEVRRKREKAQEKNAEETRRKIADWKRDRAEARERQLIQEAREEADRKRREKEQFEREQAARRPAVQAYVEQRKKLIRQEEFEPQPRSRPLSVDAKERIAARNREVYLKHLEMQQKRDLLDAIPALPSTPKASFAHIKPRLYEATACSKMKHESVSVDELGSKYNELGLGSKYSRVPGNWAHQSAGAIRTAVKTPNWRTLVA